MSAQVKRAKREAQARKRARQVRARLERKRARRIADSGLVVVQGPQGLAQAAREVAGQMDG